MGKDKFLLKTKKRANINQLQQILPKQTGFNRSKRRFASLQHNQVPESWILHSWWVNWARIVKVVTRNIRPKDPAWSTEANATR